MQPLPMISLPVEQYKLSLVNDYRFENNLRIDIRLPNNNLILSVSGNLNPSSLENRAKWLSCEQEGQTFYIDAESLAKKLNISSSEISAAKVNELLLGKARVYSPSRTPESILQTAKEVGIDESELNLISDYIATHHHNILEEMKSSSKKFYMVKSKELERDIGVKKTLTFHDSGEVTIQTNNIIGVGNNKVAKVSLGYFSGEKIVTTTASTSPRVKEFRNITRGIKASPEAHMENEKIAFDATRDLERSVTAHDIITYESIKGKKQKIFMEEFEGNLEDIESKLSEPTKENLLIKINLTLDALIGIEELHSKGLVHKDIKGSNIFVSEGRAFIADPAMLGDTTNRLFATWGTSDFMPPEVFNIDAPVNPARDVFAMGEVIRNLFAKFLKEPPKGNEDLHEIWGRLQSLIQLMKNPEIMQRPEASDIIWRVKIIKTSIEHLN